MLIETDRLILRNWTAADLAPFARMNADAKVMRHFPALMTEAQTHELMAQLKAHIDERGFGGFAVERRDTGVTIGMCGCKTISFPHSFPSDIEIGWRFDPAHWGHGFATEAAAAALRQAFQRTGVDQIMAFTVLANRASWRVMERLSMTRRADLDFDHPRVPESSPLCPHIVYSARPSA